MRSPAQRDLSGRGQTGAEARAAPGPEHERGQAEERRRVQPPSGGPRFRYGLRPTHGQRPGRSAVHQSVTKLNAKGLCSFHFAFDYIRGRDCHEKGRSMSQNVILSSWSQLSTCSSFSHFQAVQCSSLRPSWTERHPTLPCSPSACWSRRRDRRGQRDSMQTCCGNTDSGPFAQFKLQTSLTLLWPVKCKCVNPAHKCSYCHISQFFGIFLCLITSRVL